MKFSLILCTVDRYEEPKRFLKSLEQQKESEIELIIVDQNRDDRIESILLESNFSFRIIHLKTARGLSRARNLGLKHITGDIIAFPDDDGWYSVSLLRQVEFCFQNRADVDGLLGLVTNDSKISASNPTKERAGFISRMKVLRLASSHAIFLRKRFVKKVGDFDEELGVGSGTPWGAAEEADYLIRGHDHGLKIFFDPHIRVFHPPTFPELTPVFYEKALNYGAGFGRVLKKHRYPFWFVAWLGFRTSVGICLSLSCGRFSKAKYHLQTLTGRLRGWRSL